MFALIDYACQCHSWKCWPNCVCDLSNCSQQITIAVSLLQCNWFCNLCYVSGIFHNSPIALLIIFRKDVSLFYLMLFVLHASIVFCYVFHFTTFLPSVKCVNVWVRFISILNHCHRLECNSFTRSVHFNLAQTKYNSLFFYNTLPFNESATMATWF